MLSSLQNIVDHNQKAQETRLETLAKPCPFCNKNLAKYVCPRCGQGYCGLECYRSREHKECSEGFYREEVQTEVGGVKAIGEKEKMEKILRRYNVVAPEEGGPLVFGEDATESGLDGDYDFLRGATEEGGEEVDDEEENDESEDGEEDEETLRRRKDLEMRMTGVNIEDADFEDIWERLESREREEFVLLAKQLEEQEKAVALQQ